jgi:hypothetical protein
VREFEHLLVIVDLVDGDVHHRWLRKRRRGRQAEVPRRHEEDPGLERSVDRGTRLQSDHHEQREREHRAQQGKAGLPHCGSADPDRLAQAGCRGAVQQDRAVQQIDAEKVVQSRREQAIVETAKQHPADRYHVVTALVRGSLSGGVKLVAKWSGS